MLPMMATRLPSTGHVETPFRVMSAPVGCPRHSWTDISSQARGRQSVCIAARSACWQQKRVSVVPQFESAALGLRVSHCARRYYWLGKQGANSAVAVRTREIYRSANGDRWLLACDPDTARVFVRHEPNLPSGGQVADMEVGA
jgi:hypothetical protein